MEITGLTFEGVIGAAVVILVLCGAYNTIMSAIKNAREEKKMKNSPISEINDRLDQHQKFLADDKVRIERLEKDSKTNQDENRLMMRMLLALTRHAIDGNNINDLKSMRDEVNDYLVSK